MTEIERIIKDGVLPLSFFRSEIISDFYVDEKRKKIWAVSLDLLYKFDEVCRKYNLTYYLAFGSLLGAVRHHGFIPWDDDIDIMMPRDDYEKLRTLKDEFKHPYFLQIPGEDEGFYYSFAKLRNSNTSGISFPFRYEKFNQGLFIDIFILDNYNPITIKQDILIIKNLIRESSALMRRSNPFPDEKDRFLMSQVEQVRDGQEVCKDLSYILRKNENLKTDKYICWCCGVYDYHKLIFDKRAFENPLEFNLYNHQVFIPSDYESVLKTTYNNYMALPPLEERGTWHSSNIIDTEIPYEKTLMELYKKDRETPNTTKK